MIVRVRPFARGLVPVATGEESAAFDRRAVETLAVPEPTLMESAGRAAAEVVDRLYPRGEVVAVVGGGHNGGDALVALRTLAAWGRTVRAVIVADGPAPNQQIRPYGNISTLIWGTDETPAEIWSGEDFGARENVIEPPPMGSWFRIVEFPPGSPGRMSDSTSGYLMW